MPFNFPAMIPLWVFPLAIACGNTVVLKPSEKDPGASMILAKLAKEAGVPNGVLNIVHGGVDTVNFICDAPEIKAISFVGIISFSLMIRIRCCGKAYIFKRNFKWKKSSGKLGRKESWSNNARCQSESYLEPIGRCCIWSCRSKSIVFHLKVSVWRFQL